MYLLSEIRASQASSLRKVQSLRVVLEGERLPPGCFSEMPGSMASYRGPGSFWEPSIQGVQAQAIWLRSLQVSRAGLSGQVTGDIAAWLRSVRFGFCLGSGSSVWRQLRIRGSCPGYSSIPEAVACPQQVRGSASVLELPPSAWDGTELHAGFIPEQAWSMEEQGTSESLFGSSQTLPSQLSLPACIYLGFAVINSFSWVRAPS